jgi:hypothetical protein
MSGAGLIELLAARLGGRGARRSAPALREVLASAMPNRAPVTAYEPIASRLDDPMAEGAMLSGADDMAPPMPNAIRTGPDAGPSQTGRAPAIERVRVADIKFPPQENQRRLVGPWREGEAPLLLARESDGSLTAHDGNHRARLAQAEGIESVDAVILPADELNRIYTEGFEGGTIGAQAYRDVVARARRTAPDGGPVQAGRTTLYRGSDTGGRRGRWMTSDQAAAADYGPVTSSVHDTSRATEITDLADIELALGNNAAGQRQLGYFNEGNADVWDALDDPIIQQALRDEGHSVIRLADDVSPNNRRHESYLFLDRTGPNAGSDRNALQRALRDRMNRE